MESARTAGRRGGASGAALGVVAALALVALALLLFARDPASSGPRGIARSDRAPEGGAERRAPTAIESATAAPARSVRGTPAPEVPEGDPPAESRPAPERLIDLYVESVDGRPWFGVADADVPIDVAYWLVVGLAPAGTAAGDVVESATPIGSGPGRRIVREASWRCAFPAPDVPGTVALLLGDVAVAAAAVAPDAERVVLVVDASVVERATSTVTGELGQSEPSRMRLQLDPLDPPRGRGRALDPEIDGARFRFERVPPGRYRLTGTLDPLQVWDEVRRTAEGRDFDVRTLRRRLVSAAALDHCARALASLAPTVVGREFDVAPGAHVELGTLVGEPTAAVVLRLEVDGEPADAAAVRVLRLPAPGALHSTVEVRWSFGDRALVHPLPTGSSELLVRLGAHAALVSVSLPPLAPGVPPFELPVPLRATAALVLPAGAVVRTADGGTVHEGGGALNVPPGSYTVEFEGRTRAVEVAPGTTRDLTGGALR